jgi:hypothetical protein
LGAAALCSVKQGNTISGFIKYSLIENKRAKIRSDWQLVLITRLAKFGGVILNTCVPKVNVKASHNRPR